MRAKLEEVREGRNTIFRVFVFVKDVDLYADPHAELEPMLAIFEEGT